MPNETSAPAVRPEDFECPWCGPNGVPVDRTLPVELRLCDWCANPPAPVVAPPVPSPVVEQLRAILAAHVRDLHAKPWAGADFGKTIIGNAILGALEDHGCDRATELSRAVAANE